MKLKQIIAASLLGFCLACSREDNSEKELEKFIKNQNTPIAICSYTTNEGNHRMDGRCSDFTHYESTELFDLNVWLKIISHSGIENCLILEETKEETLPLWYVIPRENKDCMNRYLFIKAGIENTPNQYKQLISTKDFRNIIY